MRMFLITIGAVILLLVIAAVTIYLTGSGAAVVAWLYAINAERKSLEEVAPPLSAIG